VDSPKAIMNERQLTHTVMTVDQNIRAGINAYLERIGGPTPSSGPIVPSSIQVNIMDLNIGANYLRNEIVNLFSFFILSR
jgi:hypothetical protein